MIWETTEIEYEGFPLLLRKLRYDNIWEHQPKYPQFVCISHAFDHTKNDGLPESKYNLSLEDFDAEMCELFVKDNIGIIFLIETFRGKRNYYYYASENIDINSITENLKSKFGVGLTANFKGDPDWKFFDFYPVQLY